MTKKTPLTDSQLASKELEGVEKNLNLLKNLHKQQMEWANATFRQLLKLEWQKELLNRFLKPQTQESPQSPNEKK